MRTPADLKAARLRLGLSHREAAQLIGWPPEGDVSQMERAKSNVCWEGYAEELRMFDLDANGLREQLWCDAEECGAILTYGNDEDLAMSPRMVDRDARFASVHQAIAREVQSRIFAETNVLPPIVEYSKRLYEEYSLQHGGKSREEWAVERAGFITMRPGLPPLKLVRRSA